MTVPTQGTIARNPDFDDGLVVWSDKYSGRYQPVIYADQFDDQWRLFLERQRGFRDHTGVETSDTYVDDRISDRGQGVCWSAGSSARYILWYWHGGVPWAQTDGAMSAGREALDIFDIPAWSCARHSTHFVLARRHVHSCPKLSMSPRP